MVKNGKKLLIVESPTKARTITRMVGDDFSIMASMGHIRDLPERELGVDIEQNKNNREEAIAQISNNTLTIGDVCNSDMLKDTIANEVESITFSVNFNTGYLEFATS